MPPADKPHPFTPESISAFVCRLSGGRSLQAVCRDADMPSCHIVYRRMRADPVFKAQVEAVRDPAARGAAPGGARRGLWSQGLADGILAGLREGFSLAEICRSPACPVRAATVERWVRTKPAFAAAYAEACAPRQTARGLRVGRGRRGGYDPHIVHQIADRLLEGRSLSGIGRDPDMPGITVMWHWARRHPAFRLALERARRAQLDVLLDAVIEARDVPHRSAPARRRLAVAWRLGYRPYGAEPLGVGGVSWAATPVDGTRRGRGGAAPGLARRGGGARESAIRHALSRIGRLGGSRE